MNRHRREHTVCECRRCGTCCKKGGPALHIEDRDLVENGRIPLRDLYTIRSGELVRDNVRGTLQQLNGEIIKIKARQADSPTCRFYADHQQGCRIYSARPVECRALQCWDTRELERTYTVGRLRRKDLVGQVEGLWDLIEDHDRRCSYENIHWLIQRLEIDGRRTDADQLLEILQYDAELRNLLIERSGLEAEMLDVLLGRSLAETVHQFGIRLQRDGRRITRVVVERSFSAGETAKAEKPDE